MAIFNIRNLRKESGTPVTYIKGDSVETRVYAPNEFYALEADELTYETQNLIADNILGITNPPVTQTKKLLPYNGLPLMFGGDWVTNQYYESGWVLDFEGTYYVVVKAHTSTTNPTIDTGNYEFFSIPSVSAFFGVALGAINEHELLIKTDSGWKSDLIKADNVDALPISKITSLQTTLDNKIGNGDTLTDFILLHANPTAAMHPVTKQYADNSFVAKSGSTLTGNGHISDPVAPVAPDHLTRKGYVDTELGKKLSLTGGTLTNYLTLHAAPTSNFHAANKKWVDDNFLNKTGGALSGNVAFSSGALTLSGNPTANLHAATKQYVDNKSSFSAATFTFTGNIVVNGTATAASLISTGASTLNSLTVTNSASMGGLDMNSNVIAGVADPTSSLEAANKQWSENTFLALSGGTLTGALTLAGAPTEDLHPATKLYVDGLTSGGAALPLSGGTMTGDIDMDENSIIDPVLENPVLTGEIVLGKVEGGESGLYEETQNHQPTFKERRLITRSRVVDVYADYTVEDDVSHVRVDSEGGFVTITLPKAYDTYYSGAADDGSGNINFTVTDSSNFFVGQHVTLSGYYTGDTTILSIPDETHIIVNTAFDADATGNITAVGVSNPSDITIEKIGGVNPVVVSPPDWRTLNGAYTSLDRRGECVTLSPVFDVSNRITTGYAVTNRVTPPDNDLTAEFSVSSVTSHSEAYTAVADNGDETIRLTVADSSDFKVGDPVTLTGDYAGTSEVTFIPDGTHIDVDILYTADGTGTVATKEVTLTGLVKKWENKLYNVTSVTNNAPNSNFNVGSNAAFRVGETVKIYGGVYSGKATVLAKVSSNTITLDVTYVSNAPDTVIEVNQQTSLSSDPKKLVLTISGDRSAPMASVAANITSGATGRVISSFGNRATVVTDKDGDFQCRIAGTGVSLWAFALSAGYNQGDFQPSVEIDVTAIDILSTAITSVSNVGGNARLNVTSSAGFRAGDTIEVLGTGGVYDGEFIIDAIPSSTTIDIPETYTSNATGVARGENDTGDDIILASTRSTDFFSQGDAVAVKTDTFGVSPFNDVHESNVYYGVVRDVIDGIGITFLENYISASSDQGIAIIESSPEIDFT